MKMRWNDKELTKMYARIARKYEEADASFRETHTGLPVGVVLADMPELLTAISDHEGYAEAVSQNKPFDIIIR